MKIGLLKFNQLCLTWWMYPFDFTWVTKWTNFRKLSAEFTIFPSFYQSYPAASLVSTIGLKSKFMPFRE